MRFSFDFARNRYHSGGIDAFFIRFRPKSLSFGRNRCKKMPISPEFIFIRAESIQKDVDFARKFAWVQFFMYLCGIKTRRQWSN